MNSTDTIVSNAITGVAGMVSIHGSGLGDTFKV